MKSPPRHHSSLVNLSESFVIKDDVVKKYLKKIGDVLQLQILSPNPYLISGFMEESSNADLKNYVLVFPWTTNNNKTNASDLYFFKLDDQGSKQVKKIVCCEGFLKYDAKEDELVYLVNKTKAKAGKPVQKGVTPS